MIDPKKYNLSENEFSFIWNLLLFMFIIQNNKIINFDINSYKSWDFSWSLWRLREIIEYDDFFKNYWEKINSIEKLTWNNFENCIKIKLPNFNIENFGKNLEKNCKKIDETNSICAVLLYDYRFNN